MEREQLRRLFAGQPYQQPAAVPRETPPAPPWRPADCHEQESCLAYEATGCAECWPRGGRIDALLDSYRAGRPFLEERPS